MTEAAWHEMMREVVRQTRRILKPKGSAVFILQPNSRKVGSMRAWLFEFQAWCCREWNIVQDAYWWNTSALPTAGAPDKGMMRQSVKPCIWLGPPDCHRDQESVLWDESARNKALRIAGRCGRKPRPSGWRGDAKPREQNHAAMHAAAERRGGVTPFNVIPLGCGRSAGEAGHPAGTPEDLADWWTRYISPPGGVVADWFAGSGTMALAALKRGRSFVGIEKMSEYHAIATKRIAEAEAVA